MASFIDRVRYASDWETDGGEVAIELFDMSLSLYIGGIWTAAQLKAQHDCTAAQGTQIDAILATRPVAPLLLLNVPAYVQWKDKIVGIMRAAQKTVNGFTTDALVKTALGI